MKDELLYEKMNPPGIGALVFILLGALPTGAVLLFMLFVEQPVTAPVPLIVVLFALGGLFWALLEGAGTRASTPTASSTSTSSSSAARCASRTWRRRRSSRLRSRIRTWCCGLGTAGSSRGSSAAAGATLTGCS